MISAGILYNSIIYLKGMRILMFQLSGFYPDALGGSWAKGSASWAKTLSLDFAGKRAGSWGKRL